MSMRSVCFQKGVIHSPKCWYEMIKPKPIRALKLNVNKNLLTMLVNYLIINIINNFPEEYHLIQCIHPIPTVLHV